MNQNDEQLINDPKGQGLPPPYTDNASVPPQPAHTQGYPYPPQGSPYPPQGSPYPPPPVQGVVYTSNVTSTVIPVVVGPQMGPKPSAITCRSCNQQIITRVEYKSSTKTHLFALLLCLVFWPCVCLPYCIDSCHNADHYCPNCNAYIGSYSS